MTTRLQIIRIYAQIRSHIQRQQLRRNATGW